MTKANDIFYQIKFLYRKGKLIFTITKTDSNTVKY